MANTTTPHETSPLLSNPANPPSDPLNSGLASAGPQAQAWRDENDYGTVDEENASNNTLHRTQSALAREQQYEGIPEIRNRMWLMFPAMGVGVFMAAADQTLVVSSAGRIGSELGALEKTSWIATAYLLTLTSFQPLYGKMSDIFSRKSCLLFAYVVFCLGCLACGLAQTMDQLIIFRAIAGIGGGGMTTLVSIILSDAIPLKERGTWQGYINIVYGTGSSIGAPLGGLFSDSIGWRWAFLGQAPICLVALTAVFFLMKMPKREQTTDWKTKLRRIDFLGAITLVGAVSLLLVGMDHGSNQSWRDLLAILPVCGGAVLAAAWLLIELKVATEPFAPKRIITSTPLLACYFSNFFQFAGYMALTFYLPLHYQASRGMSAAKAGLLLVPGILATVVGSLSAGFVMQRTGKYYWLTCMSFLQLSIGVLIVCLCSGVAVSSVPGMVVGHVWASLGTGIAVTSTLIALISNAGREDQAVATACSYLFRSLGSTAGISVASTVVNQTLRSFLFGDLGHSPRSEKIVAGVRRSLEYIKVLPPGLQSIVRACYGRATSVAFAVQSAILLSAFVSSLFIKEKPLSAKK